MNRKYNIIFSSIGMILFAYSFTGRGEGIYFDAIYLSVFIYGINLPKMIWKGFLAKRQEKILRLSSSIPCGILLYFGYYWNGVFHRLLLSFQSNISFSTEEIIWFVVSAFAFIIIVILSTGVVTRYVITDSQKINLFNGLVMKALIATFLVGIGGTIVIGIILLISSFAVLIKVVSSRSTKKINAFITSVLEGEEKNFWLVLINPKKKSGTDFFYMLIGVGIFILITNIPFIKIDSILQILFLSISGSAIFLGYYGIRKDWTRFYHKIVGVFPYVIAFILAMIFPLSFPCNSFLIERVGDNTIPIPNTVQYAIPLVTFILVFGLLASIYVSSQREETKEQRSVHLILSYLGGLIAFTTFAFAFELFFMDSISEGWFSHTIQVDGQVLGGLPEVFKSTVGAIGCAILTLSAIFYGIANYIDLSKYKYSWAKQPNQRIISCTVIFVVFVAFSASFYFIDKILIDTTRTNTFVWGKLNITSHSDLNLPIPKTNGWIKIDTKSLSNDMINVAVFNQGYYKIREFNITEEEKQVYMEGLGGGDYLLSFHLQEDRDLDGISSIMLYIEHGSSEIIYGPLGAATVWNFIILVPHLKRIID